jgi:hypothetical protein
METGPKKKFLIDLEKLNTLGAQGCPACGRSFELGEVIVLARGSWEGQKYIHEDDAVHLSPVRGRPLSASTLDSEDRSPKTHNFPTNSLMAAMYSVIPFRKMSL